MQFKPKVKCWFSICESETVSHTRGLRLHLHKSSNRSCHSENLRDVFKCFSPGLFFFSETGRVQYKCRRMLTRGRLRCTRAQRVPDCRPGSSASPLEIVVNCSGRRPKALAPLRIQEPRNLPRAWSAVRSPAGVQQSSEHAARVTPLLLPRVLTVASHHQRPARARGVLPLYMRTSPRADRATITSSTDHRRKAATQERVQIRCA